MTRREILKVSAVAAIAGSTHREVWGEPRRDVSGAQRYEAEVPDTLDLAERAGFSVNALTGAADPEHGYDAYFSGHLGDQPPYMSHGHCGTCTEKPVHALPMMRVMSGSTLNPDIDGKIMQSIIRNVEADGLWWLRTQGIPWRGICKDEVPVHDSGRFMVVLGDWYRYDHDSQWLAILERMGRGLARIAVQQDDRAMFHDYYHGPDSKVQSGTNVIYTNGLALRGFTRWYAESGDKEALEMAKKIARHMQSPAAGAWKPSEGPAMIAASEHAHWDGHFHSHTMGMIGLIEYGNLVNDVQAKTFVGDFYEYSRNFGIGRIGFFPNMVGSLERMSKWAAHYTGDGSAGVCDEGCAVSDMTQLAIQLSDGGVGDYWDDVDQYVRNHLTEHQVLRRDLLEEIIAAAPEHKTAPPRENDSDIIARNIGCFLGTSDPTIGYPWWVMCCNANCAVAMYKAWESIVRYSGGAAQVNLLLNRASAWLDVDSYLPYEGKVVLKNKTARQICVRTPKWADKRAIRCRLNQKDIPTHWAGNYLLISGLGPRDEVVVEFPMVETLEKYTEATYRQQYTCRFRGNALIDISPRAERPRYEETNLEDDRTRFPVNKGYPLYLREFRGQAAPNKKVQRYVSPVLI